MIKPTPARHETVTLWHGDDYQPLAELIEKVKTAAAGAAVGSPARLGDDVGMRGATEAYDAFRADALTRATEVEVYALGRKAWRDLLKEHPARKVTVPGEDGTPQEVDHPEDYLGWNAETLPDPLVRASLTPDPSSDAEPQFESDDARDTWLDGLSDPEFSLLYSAAVRLNTSGGPDPKAHLSSLLDRTSSETSTSPERLG